MNIIKNLHSFARCLMATVSLGAVLSPSVRAQIPFTGTPYVQDFNTLATTGTANTFTDNTTLVGWYAQSGETGYNQNLGQAFTLAFPASFNNIADQYRADTGASNTGDVYSFGAASATERAFGSIGSGTPPDFFIAMAVQNQTGLPLSQFTVTYDGEQWRLGGNTPQRPETLFAYVRIGGTALDGTGTWLPVTNLNFTTPNNADSAGIALDGNLPGNRVAGISATIAAPVQPNEIVWILWVDVDSVGSDHALAIDNVNFTAVNAAAGAPVISSSSSAGATANSPFSYSITASGSPTAYSASAFPSGSLPAWLSINTSTGELTGTPPVPGSYPLTVSATNGIGTGSAILTITVAADPLAPVIEASQAIEHLINTPLSYQVLASNSPTSYTIGTLPAGLEFDTATGIISGTPTVTANFNNVPVSATNDRGTGTGTINIALVSAPALTSDTSVSTYTGTTFSFAAVFTQTPFSYLMEGLPAGLENLSAGNITGTVTSAPGTYPVTITATNSYGSTVVVVNIIVLDAAAQSAIPLNVVVNKFSNSDPDKVELLVVGNGTPGSTVDMRGMILKDFSGSNVSDGGGRAVFANSSFWSAVPAGTLVVISAGTSATEEVIVSDYNLAVNMGNPNYFTSTGSFDIATTEMIMIKAAGTGLSGVAGGIHVLASGSITGAQYVAFTGPKSGTTTQTAFPNAVFISNATSTLADYTGGTVTGAPAANLTFGAGNNATNQTYIDSLRLTGTPPSLIEEWLIEYFGTSEDTEEVLFGATEDFDGDGLSNLLEYAFNTDPTEAGASPVVTTRDGNFLTLTYPMIADPALAYTVVGSSDLTVGFGEATGDTETVAGVSTYTDDVDLSAPGVRRFLRVEVTYTE